jgi:hypothetical protein
MTDAGFMLRVLERGPATTMDVIQASITERGCGITPHSRAADLRRDGYDIQCRHKGANHKGRPVYEYRLVERPVQLELV